MNGAFGNSEDLGAFIIWAGKLFKGKFEDRRDNKYSFIIGLGSIIVSILILFLVD